MTARRQLLLAETNRDIEKVRRARQDPDPHTRALALGSLDRLDELSNEHLVDGLGDIDRDVRIRAIELAYKRRGIELVSSLSDEDDLVVETAAWALGEREDDDPDTLAALITVAENHTISICREAAIAALGAIGDARGIPAILKGLDDRAPVRRRAVGFTPVTRYVDGSTMKYASLDSLNRQLDSSSNPIP